MSRLLMLFGGFHLIRIAQRTCAESDGISTAAGSCGTPGGSEINVDRTKSDTTSVNHT